MLKIFNTLTRQKEEFKPIHAGEVGMYVCGITVYDLCHIGHGRTFVAFDVVARYLRFLGYKLKYVYLPVLHSMCNRLQRTRDQDPY